MISLWLGLPGTGKTTFMRDRVNLAAWEGWGCAVIDRAAEWSIDDKGWRGNPPEIRIASEDRESAKNSLLLAREKGHVVLFRHPWEPLDVAQIVSEVGDLIFVDDEIDLTATYKDWLGNPLRNFVHRGRHLPDDDGVPREVHIYGAARRPQNLHTDLTSMADEVFIFRVAGANTLKRLVAENYITESMVEIVRNASTMPNFKCVMWKNDGSTTFGRISNPYL